MDDLRAAAVYSCVSGQGVCGDDGRLPTGIIVLLARREIKLPLPILAAAGYATGCWNKLLQFFSAHPGKYVSAWLGPVIGSKQFVVGS